MNRMNWIIITCLVVLAGVYIYFQQPIFGGKIEGERKIRVEASKNFKDGSFQNLSETPSLAEGYTMTQAMWEFLTDKTENKKPNKKLVFNKTDIKSLDPKEDILIWMGHSSYYIQLDGKKFLVDPVFSGNASPIPGTTKAFEGTDLYTEDDFTDIDYLIISHDHYDHLDYKTIKKLRPKIKKVVCGLGVGAHFERWDYKPDQLIELDWYESADLIKGFKITSTPARHFSGRTFKRNNTLWSSYVLETPTQKLFIGGDSGYDYHFKEIGEKFGPFDWAILENGQYNEKWKYIHTLPTEFVKVVEDLNAKNVIPVHSAKFSLAQHSWQEPLETVYENSKEKNFKLYTPKIGDKLLLDDYTVDYPAWWRDIKN